MLNELLDKQLQKISQDHSSSASLEKTQLLLLPSVLQLALFTPLAWWAHKHPVHPVDVKITRLLQKRPFLVLCYPTNTVCLITGSPMLLRALAVLLATILWAMRLRLEAVMTTAIGLSSEVIKNILQFVVDRPRPSPMLVRVQVPSNWKSFPSGHVISSITFWGWLLALARILLRGNSLWEKWRRALTAISLLFMGAVGPSRIYLGDHWASDVLGGYLFGSAWLGLFVQLYLTLKRKGVLSK